MEKMFLAWLNEAWRLYGKDHIAARGRDLDPEVLDELSDDDVAKQFLWEGIQDFLENEKDQKTKESLFLYQRVGELENALGSLMPVVSGIKSTVQKNQADGAQVRAELAELRASILKAFVGED